MRAADLVEQTRAAKIAEFEGAADAEESFDATAALRRVVAEVHDWPAADFWHRDAILRAIRGTA